MTTSNNEDGLKGLAVAGLVLGSLSWFMFGVFFAPLGLIFSILGMGSKDSTTKTVATIGLVISVVACIVLLFSIMAAMSLMR